MAFTAIPSGDVWVQIGTTQTPTSGSSVSFTSIPAVKKLRVVVQSLTLTAAGYVDITLNNDTGSNYNYGYVTYNGTTASVIANNDTKMRVTRSSGTSHIIELTIDYTNQAMPKLAQGYGTSGGSNASVYPASYNWNSTAVVNRIDFTTATTFAAGNTGTIAIYGAF